MPRKARVNRGQGLTEIKQEALCKLHDVSVLTVSFQVM